MLSHCVQSFSSHSWCAFSCVFDACVCGEVGLKPCASCVLTQLCEYLQITWITDNQMYKMCLVSNRPATSSSSSSTLGTITQSHWSQLLFHLGSVRSIYSDTIESAQTVERIRCALIQNLFDSSHQLTRHRLNLWHLSARTAIFTTQNLHNIRNDCLQSMCTVKRIFKPVYCILRLSLSTPVLNFPSRFLKLFKICNMLDWPSSSGLLCFIIYNLVGLWVYIWRRNEPPWCPVLFRCEMGWTATRSVWCRSEPVITNHCCDPDSSETFVICSTFSVFNIKFL